MGELENTARMALAPLTLADRIPTIAEVITAAISGPRKVAHPTRGHEFYHFTAEYIPDAEGGYIVLDVSEYGPNPDTVRVFVHVSQPIIKG